MSTFLPATLRSLSQCQCDVEELTFRKTLVALCFWPVPTSSYPTALEMVASGRVNVKPLITHTYKLEETLKAFQRAKTGEGGAIKVCMWWDIRLTPRASTLTIPLEVLLAHLIEIPELQTVDILFLAIMVSLVPRLFSDPLVATSKSLGMRPYYGESKVYQLPLKTWSGWSQLQSLVHRACQSIAFSLSSLLQVMIRCGSEE